MERNYVTVTLCIWMRAVCWTEYRNTAGEIATTYRTQSLRECKLACIIFQLDKSWPCDGIDFQPGRPIHDTCSFTTPAHPKRWHHDKKTHYAIDLNCAGDPIDDLYSQGRSYVEARGSNCLLVMWLLKWHRRNDAWINVQWISCRKSVSVEIAKWQNYENTQSCHS